MDTHPPLLSYYEAIEQASADMLSAAQRGDWAQVLKLEGACGVLISRLKHATQTRPLAPEQARTKARILQRILLNDARIRSLAEPWHDDMDRLPGGPPCTIH
jgi:flagellar protein FliT